MPDLTLDLPPFPPLHWDGDSWIADLQLPSWAGYKAGRREPADGSVQLRVFTSDSQTRPSSEQMAAFRHLMENEAAVAAVVGQALVDNYPGDEDLDENEEELESPEDLRQLVGLAYVHLLNVAKDGVAYIGFEFGCAWDEEHGAGVMTHLGRAVATGQADVSFLEWIAERDAAK